jgi:hypothetical protein
MQVSLATAISSRLPKYVPTTSEQQNDRHRLHDRHHACDPRIAAAAVEVAYNHVKGERQGIIMHAPATTMLFPDYDIALAYAVRSPLWNAVRDRWINTNPECACCGRRENLSAHHIRPFHLFPELELEISNLITLCEGGPINCHYLAGHAGRSWSHYSQNIALAVEQVRSMARLLKLGAE